MYNLLMMSMTMMMMMQGDMERLQLNITPMGMMDMIMKIMMIMMIRMIIIILHTGGHGTTATKHHTNGDDGQRQKRRASRNAGPHIISIIPHIISHMYYCSYHQFLVDFVKR